MIVLGGDGKLHHSDAGGEGLCGTRTTTSTVGLETVALFAACPACVARLAARRGAARAHLEELVGAPPEEEASEDGAPRFAAGTLLACPNCGSAELSVWYRELVAYHGSVVAVEDGEPELDWSRVDSESGGDGRFDEIVCSRCGEDGLGWGDLVAKGKEEEEA